MIHRPTSQFFIAVFIMMLPFPKAFGMPSLPKNHKGAIRQIALSGNMFLFSTPENFSSNMPAEALIEQVDLEKLNDSKDGVLIRR